MSTVRTGKNLSAELSQITKSVERTQSADPVDTPASSPQQASRWEWQHVTDQLLSWLSKPESAIPDEGYLAPERLLLETAIDFAFDMTECCGAPTSVSSTAGGGVSFQWRSGNKLTEVEVVRVGEIEVTVVSAGRVIRHTELRRDPLTRKLQQTTR
jgi:hypothetical protein